MIQRSCSYLWRLPLKKDVCINYISQLCFADYFLELISEAYFSMLSKYYDVASMLFSNERKCKRLTTLQYDLSGQESVGVGIYSTNVVQNLRLTLTVWDEIVCVSLAKWMTKNKTWLTKNKTYISRDLNIDWGISPPYQVTLMRSFLLELFFFSSI